MSTLTPTSTSTSNKTVVAFAVIGGVAIAAMVFFGMSARKKTPKNDMFNYLTPGYSDVSDDIIYRPLSDTPVIEEQKPRPIDPKMEVEGAMMQDQGFMIKNDMKLKGY